MGPIIADGADYHARRLGTKANHLALVGGPARAPGAAEVQPFEQVRLTRSVWPCHERQPFAECDASPLVVAEIPQGEGPHEHPGERSLDVQPDGHDQVAEAALVSGLNQPWAKRADQLKEYVPFLDRLQAVAEELRVESDLERLTLEGHRE